MKVDPVVRPVRFWAHARENLCSRDATEQEVVEAIRTASWARAELGFHLRTRLEGQVDTTNQVRRLVLYHPALILTGGCNHPVQI